MRTNKFLIFLWGFLLHTVSYPHCIVFVHIGNTLPSYLYDAIVQARCFNKNCTIYLLANEIALQDYATNSSSQLPATLIYLESLSKTKAHQEFLAATTLDKYSRQGFWLFASERFLFLNDFAQQFNENDIFHLESDNMLYVNIESYLPIFKEYYHGMALILDNEQRCIPSIMYFAQPAILAELSQYFADQASNGKNDMEVTAKFFHNKVHTKEVDSLPIIFPAYVETYGLTSQAGHKTLNQSRFYNHIDMFNSIFDGAALGQYLGGIDPRNGPSSPGFINESCLFNPSLLNFEWRRDSDGRKVPYVLFKGKSYRINNLHIHSKNLKNFSSI
jgi:hypothetical protein